MPRIEARHRMAQEFSRRSIAGFVAGMLVATVLTVMGTFYVLHRFVLDNPADPLTKAGGLRPSQKVNWMQVNERTPPHGIGGGAKLIGR
jgi:hypothetical protein